MSDRARQVQDVQFSSPVPPHAQRDAARLWAAHFAPWPLWRDVPAINAAAGIVALCGPGAAWGQCVTAGPGGVTESGAVAGVIGLRDADGGFAADAPALHGWLFRAAPATDDLVIDGLAVTPAWHRRRIGAGLIAQAAMRAQVAHRPGLRAEVRAADRGAVAFYRDQGFSQIAQGRYGWPWGGPVLILRRAV